MANTFFVTCNGLLFYAFIYDDFTYLRSSGKKFYPKLKLQTYITFVRSSIEKSSNLAFAKPENYRLQIELIRRINALFTAKKTVFESAIPFNGKNEKPGHLGRPLKVLLAGDNHFNQMMAMRLLEKMGHRVQIAGNGVEALKLVQKDRFDLILMDVQMPEMNGFDATRHIRKLDSDVSQIPIIAMTVCARFSSNAANDFFMPFKSQFLTSL